MKKIVGKSHKKEIAYKLSKKVTQTKLGGGSPVQIGLKRIAQNEASNAFFHTT